MCETDIKWVNLKMGWFENLMIKGEEMEWWRGGMNVRMSEWVNEWMSEC